MSDVREGEDGDSLPGVVVLDRRGEVESISPQAERWLDEIAEVPPPRHAHEARVVHDPTSDALAARARAQTRSGRWLLVYGTKLAGGLDGRVAVIIQPAGPHDIAPLVAQAYSLSGRERDITRLCFRGLSTKEIAAALHISAYTVQDHLKSIFDKTGTRSRAELVGQIFLEHYVPRFEELERPPVGWNAQVIDTGQHP